MQPLSLQALAAAALLLGCSGLTVQAGSIGTSLAVGGSSASVGSSASSEASSNSSGGGQKTALGPYRIVDVTEVAGQPGQPGQPGQVRLQLQALAADAPEPGHVLLLPQAIAAQYRLAAGQTVTARARAYGTEFVHDASRQAFYLVLTDGFRRELDAQPVRL